MRPFHSLFGHRLPLALAALLAAACSSEKTNPPGNPDARADAGTSPDAPAPDAPEAPDTGMEPDSGTETPDAGPTNHFPRLTCADVTGTCFEFEATERDQMLEAINTLEDDTTIILGAGTFELDNALTIRGADGVTLTGQGIDVTTLDFKSQVTQSNGVDVVGDRFAINHLTIVDSKKDGLRIEESTDVAIQFVKVTWSAGPSSMNGGYAIYPVRCTNVLMEDSEAYHASDAGLYIGQSINVIVRRNIARRNVAGIEIENTQFADVYENTAEENTGGLLVFDLPGNPVIGRDIKIHNNVVRNNNTGNFAMAGTTVGTIPRGTGTFALASRRVEITGNTYENNNTTDIAILSGLVVEGSTGAWALPIEMVRGSTVGIDVINTGTHILNFRTTEVWIHGNTHMGSGTAPDMSNQEVRPLGALLFALYYLGGTGPVDTILYDGIGEVVDPGMDRGNNTNNNHLCVENETGATYATLDLPKLAAISEMMMLPTLRDIYQPAPPFSPFDCSGFTSGPIPEVRLPFVP